MASTVAVLDLSNYKDRVGSRVAPGTYRVVVEDTEMDKAKSGNTMFNVWFRILDGEHKDSTITDRLVDTPAAHFRIVGFLNAIGIPTPRKRISIDLAKWIGRTLDIEVDDGEPYNGRVKSEVRAYIKVAKSEAASDDLEVEEEPNEEAPVAEPEPDEPKGEAVAEGQTPEAVDLDEIDLG